MATQPPPHYAESVMVQSLSRNGLEEVSLRLARFPGHMSGHPGNGIAHVWVHVATRRGAWSLVEESFELTRPGATPVGDDQADFHAVRGTQWLRYEAERRNSGRLRGRVSGRLLVAPTRHPLVRTGSLPLLIDTEFEARSPGYRSPANRWEITGRLCGMLQIGGKTLQIDHDHGKWHEQTGPRARFAPAFTYLNVQNDRVALLAIGFERGASGYALIGDESLDVRAFAIDPAGSTERNFVVTLEDGRRVEGRCRVVQVWSVPIEGQRRPGSSVLAESNLGTLWGALNDWKPQAQ